MQRTAQQPQRTVTVAACAIDDCQNAAEVSGICRKHYMRRRRHGTTDLLPRPTRQADPSGR